MKPLDREAQKQLLLARIAYQRIELRRELAQVREAARVPQLLRTVLGGGTWSRALFGVSGTDGAGWLGQAWSLLRRYRVAATLLGALAPTLGGRSRRLLRLGVLGVAAWFGWRAARTRRR
ncbi:MAG: hypothetical protein ABL916_19900 [Burkholderiaceae bacterium]